MGNHSIEVDGTSQDVQSSFLLPSKEEHRHDSFKPVNGESFKISKYPIFWKNNLFETQIHLNLT